MKKGVLLLFSWNSGEINLLLHSCCCCSSNSCCHSSSSIEYWTGLSFSCLLFTSNNVILLLSTDWNASSPSFFSPLGNERCPHPLKLLGQKHFRNLFDPRVIFFFPTHRVCVVPSWLLLKNTTICPSNKSLFSSRVSGFRFFLFKNG